MSDNPGMKTFNKKPRFMMGSPIAGTPKPKKKICLNCYYAEFYASLRRLDENAYCHRYPTHKGGNHVIVGANDWCGEFKEMNK